MTLSVFFLTVSFWMLMVQAAANAAANDLEEKREKVRIAKQQVSTVECFEKFECVAHSLRCR
jgi:hypothetical protein